MRKMGKQHLKKKRQSKHALIKIAARTKFKRLHKGLIKGFEFNKISTSVCYGMFGLKILKPLKLTQKQVESFRAAIARKKLLKKKKHNMWVRGLLNIPVTKKPNEFRMGKGKGSLDHWIMRIKPGKIFVELSRMSIYRARRIFKIIEHILGVPAQMISLEQSYPYLRFPIKT
jgi:large subunit ribosomal protein L16